MNTKFFVVNGQNMQVSDHITLKFNAFVFELWHLENGKIMLRDGDDYLLCSSISESFIPKSIDFELYEDGLDSYGIKTTMSIFRESKNQFYVELEQGNYISKYLGEKIIPQKF